MRIPIRFVAPVAILFVAKMLVTVFLVPVSPASDFGNWVIIAQYTSQVIHAGRLPSIADFGPYIGMDAFLSFFFDAWSALPITHLPTWAVLAASSGAEHYLLILFMKMPILLFDLLAGVMVYYVTKMFASRSTGMKAFFVWYLNPYVFYLTIYGSQYDIIPAALVLLSILLALRRNWWATGLSMSVATILRVFPIFALPFFALYAYRQKPRVGVLKFLAAFSAPLALGIGGQSLAPGAADFMSTISGELLKTPWLLEYFQGVPRDSPFPTIFFLIAVQFYIAARYWKSDSSILNLTLVTLLVVLTATYEQPYYFMWVIPLLTVYYMVDRPRWTLLFVLIFVTAYLAFLGFDTADPTLTFLESLFQGAFYGIKVVYIGIINLMAIRPTLFFHVQWSRQPGKPSPEARRPRI